MTAPLVWPRTGSGGDRLHVALQEVVNEAVGLTASGADLLPAYLRWAVAAVGRLRPHLPGDDVDRLIRTATFWAAVGLDSSASAVPHLVNEELSSREDELRRVVDSVDSFRQRFLGVPETALVLVPDTNVLLAYAETMRDADWRGIVQGHARPLDTVRLLIPLATIDELDRLKDNAKQPTRTRARLMLRTIHELIGHSPDSRPVLQPPSQNAGRVTFEILMESPGHRRLPRTDDELVDVVARLQDMVGPRVVMTTFDTGADLRAAVRSLRHVRLGQAISTTP